MVVDTGAGECICEMMEKGKINMRLCCLLESKRSHEQKIVC